MVEGGYIRKKKEGMGFCKVKERGVFFNWLLMGVEKSQQDDSKG